MNLFRPLLQRVIEKAKNSITHHGTWAISKFLLGQTSAVDSINDASSKVVKDTLCGIALEGAELAANYLAPQYRDIAKIGAQIATQGVRATFEGQDVRKVIKNGLATVNLLAVAPLGGFAPLGGWALRQVTDYGVDKTSDAITHAYTNYTNAADQKAFQAKLQNFSENEYVQECINDLSESFTLIKVAASAA